MRAIDLKNQGTVPTVSRSRIKSSFAAPNKGFHENWTDEEGIFYVSDQRTTEHWMCQEKHQLRQKADLRLSVSSSFQYQRHQWEIRSQSLLNQLSAASVINLRGLHLLKLVE
nr:unnamed protein product [Spirometra erinaceieuropaei]